MDLMLTKVSPIYLASTLEYLTAEILENAVILAKYKKRVRILIRDIEMSVRNDIEFNRFLKFHHLLFLGGGVIPYIHPKLMNKTPPKRKVKTDVEKEPRHYRFRPGTVALRDIRRFQKTSDCLILTKLSFEKCVRDKVQKLINKDSNIKISKGVFTILQYFIEQKMIEIMFDANAAAIHANRVKVTPADIFFILSRYEQLNSLVKKPELNQTLEINNEEDTNLKSTVEEDDEEGKEDNEEYKLATR